MTGIAQRARRNIPAIWTTLASVLLLPATLWSSERPNVIFLYADDLAAWAIGALGNSEARTPNIDSL